jgi:hypothetical protein
MRVHAQLWLALAMGNGLAWGGVSSWGTCMGAIASVTAPKRVDGRPKRGSDDEKAPSKGDGCMPTRQTGAALQRRCKDLLTVDQDQDQMRIGLVRLA